MCLYRYLDMFICLDIYIYGFIPAGGGARGRGGGILIQFFPILTFYEFY